MYISSYRERIQSSKMTQSMQQQRECYVIIVLQDTTSSYVLSCSEQCSIYKQILKARQIYKATKYFY